MIHDASSPELKEYEVACVASTDGALLEIVNALKKRQVSVTEEGRMVSVRLAYPLQKQTSGFFGFVRFTTAPEHIADIEKEFRSFPSVLRFLIVTPPPQTAVRGDRRTALRTPTPPQPLPEAPALTNEALEQKLEEILK